MSDKKSNESRRKLLKSIAAGSGAIVAGKSLPDKWTAPVVDSVLLPAHAQTSPAPTTTAAPGTTAAPVPCAGPYTATFPDHLFLNISTADGSFTASVGPVPAPGGD